jgi:beta-glucosidase
MNSKKIAVFISLLLFSFVPRLQAQEEPAYKNPKLPIEQRVNDLVKRMTLKEKVSQLGHTADAIPRLGVPQYDWWSEGLHGVASAGNATVFPQAIGLAAMFDEPLTHQIADVTSTEFRAKYVDKLRPDGSSDWFRGLTVWSPNINIFRDPRWGRGQETYGEDPFLTSRIGLAFVTGLQGDDPKYLKAVSTPKHFAVHSGPEPTRHKVDVTVSKHDMEDTYFPAFRTLVMQGKADSVMCAYNSVNGQPACANNDLLEKHLRGAWGFQGYVVSDCGAVKDVFGGHQYTKTIEEAAADSFKAGTDLVCAWPVDTRVKYEKDALEAAVEKGILKESVLDEALRRLFTARMRLGMFDPPSMVPWSKITAADYDTEKHRQLSLKAAHEALVLLKNENGFLPLKKTYNTIAVIGPDADNVDALTGNYNGTPSKPKTVLTGIKNRFKNSNVIYAQGVGLTGPAENAKAEDEALEAVRKADLAVVVLGLSPKIEGEEMKIEADGFSGGDRTKIELPAVQEKLLERIYAEEKPVILVLLSGSAIAANWADGKVPAIIEAWYPGEEGGTAVADVIAGDYNPAGRLPVTFYKSLDQLPPFEDYSMAKRTYRYFDGEPLYPFGYGLSYTSFAYKNPKVAQDKVDEKGTVSFSVEVTNTGKLAGDEVAQLYITHVDVSGAPIRALQGFRRVHLEPGQRTTVDFKLENRQLSVVDAAGTRRVVPGEVKVWIGGGQPLSRAGLPKTPGVETQFTISGQSVLPE